MSAKKLAALLTALIMIATCSIPAYAVDYDVFVNEEISVCYLVTKSAASALSISGTKATCSSRVKGFESASQITITQTLEKRVGAAFSAVSNAEWTETFNGSSANFANSKSGLGSGIYRVKSVFTVTTSGGQSETVTAYSSEGTI